jgi:spore coat protein CotH
MLCKRPRDSDILASSKRAKLSSVLCDFKKDSLCGKRKQEQSDCMKFTKFAKLCLEKNDDVPHLVISELTDSQKQKNNTWDDILYGADPRNHFARNHYATDIQRVFKGWLIRREYKSNPDTEHLINFMNSMNI